RRRFQQDWYADMRQKLSEILGRSATVAPARQSVVNQRGRTPVLADYVKTVQSKLTLRARFKGKTLWAYVRASGLIWFDGKHFTSPSLAGAHAVKRSTCNGWTFWQYQRAPGDWVALNNLRK